jgi:ATP-dependent Clp protease ATP-binding subunit ClpX
MAAERSDPTSIQSGGTPTPRRTQCSFCGRTSDVTGSMVEGPSDVYICGDCAEIAYGIILQQRARSRVWPDQRDPTHRQ